MTASPTLAPGLVASLNGAQSKPAPPVDKARATAQDFEAMYLNVMFGQMFAGVGNGPYGGGHAANLWRSFLTDEYAKSFAKAGGIGISDQIHRALLELQEGRTAAAASPPATKEAQ